MCIVAVEPFEIFNYNPILNSSVKATGSNTYNHERSDATCLMVTLTLTICCREII